MKSTNEWLRAHSLAEEEEDATGGLVLPFLLGYTVWRGQRSLESGVSPRETFDAGVIVFSDSLQLYHPRASGLTGYVHPEVQWLSAPQTFLYYLLLPHPSKQ